MGIESTPTATVPSAPAEPGAFSFIKLAPETAPTPEATPKPPETTPAATAVPGADTTPPPAKPGEAPVTPPPAAAPRVYAGRFPNVEGLEHAYDESSKEGRRLNSELEKAHEARTKAENELAELKLNAELGMFVELTPEELTQLKEDAPHKADLYMHELKEHKVALARMKRDHDRSQQATKIASEQMEQLIVDRVAIMERDTKTYPDHVQLQPLMEEMASATKKEINGYSWTADALYYMAYGFRALQAEFKSRQATDAAQRAAAEKAAADARQAGTTGAPVITGTAPAGNGGRVTDEEYNKRLISKGPKPIFQS